MCEGNCAGQVPVTALIESAMASLCLLDNNGAIARRWELDQGPVSVGRGETADVVIGDASLSRRHFVVDRVGDGYVLKDLNSNNGTWVDGQPAKDTRLRHHDCILAGRTLFLFCETAATTPGQAASGSADAKIGP
jgi:pSer/pThr/pTyr-binding forkhead associated (FHA) protein